MVMLWLSLFAAIWLFEEPSRRANEMLHNARERVAREVVCDPLFWVCAILIIIVFIRWMNNGIAMAYDAENLFWYIKKPALEYMPGAVEDRGFLEFATLISVTVILMGIRHALGKSARIGFLFSSSLYASIAAVVASFCLFFGQKGAAAAARGDIAAQTCVGLAFGIHTIAGIAALAGAMKDRWGYVVLLFTIAIGGAAAGAFIFSPSEIVVLLTAGIVLVLLASLLWLAIQSGGAASMKFFAAIFISVAFAILVVFCLMPDKLFDARIEAIATLNLLPSKFMQIREMLSGIALKIWRENPWLGTGLGSFPLDVRFNATPDDWSVIRRAPEAAYSGWWTFIAERGIVGALMFATPLLFMAFTFIRRLFGVLGVKVFWPGCVFGLAVVLVAFAETFIDISAFRPEAMMSIAAAIAIMAASIPPREKIVEDVPKSKK